MVADSPDGKVARPHVLMNSPRGIRYMFATECSKPVVTKAETVNSTVRILSLVVLAPMDSHTAKANQLVAQHAEQESAVEQKIDLGVGQSDGDGRRGALASQELALHEHRGPERSDEVTGVDDPPEARSMSVRLIA